MAMAHYIPPTEEIFFLLSKVLDGSKRLRAMSAFADFDDELMQQVLDESGKFVAEIIAPLNRVGDEVGAKWNDGVVTMPPGFKNAYQVFWKSGWPALSASPDHGGQGLPTVLEVILYEMLSAANHGWTMAPGLLHGAYECIRHFGSDTVKEKFLEKLATGEWLATMCLTEPQAGSDLGLCQTKALPIKEGGFALSGTKIFISGGEHDLTENIVHLVLARLPDSPPGPKGLSLFVLPKFYEDGSQSAVFCERIEEKMGIHGSPTCVLRFDEATAEMVGEPGKGLNAMFIMMNAARLHVAFQGVGLLDAALQKADAYARERRQMRVAGSPNKKSPQVPDLIIEHPAVSRILDTQRAWVVAGRVLGYATAIRLDQTKHGTEAERASAERWCALTTPVLKASFTNQAFHGGSDCLQVFGGHGYIREWGMEQHVRDARVSMIYEGTNEIQAIDLLVRKVIPDRGQNLNTLLDELEDDLKGLPRYNPTNRSALRNLRDVTPQILSAHDNDVTIGHKVADDFLRIFTLALMEWAWAKVYAVTLASSVANSDPQWSRPFKAFQGRILLELDTRVALISEACIS